MAESGLIGISKEEVNNRLTTRGYSQVEGKYPENSSRWFNNRGTDVLVVYFRDGISIGVDLMDKLIDTSDQALIKTTLSATDWQNLIYMTTGGKEYQMQYKRLDSGDVEIIQIGEMVTE